MARVQIFTTGIHEVVVAVAVVCCKPQWARADYLAARCPTTTVTVDTMECRNVE
jgi:hypothetical protein